MKELNSHNRESNMAIVVKEQKRHTFVASIHPHKGHTFYEFNLVSGEIKPAEIKEVTAKLGGGTTSTVLTKSNCIYTAALNIENAQKKFFKYMRSK